MSPAIIAQIIVALGPSALLLIPKLAEIWHKPDLTPQEVADLCLPAHKSYEQYRAEAMAAAPSLAPATVAP